MKKKKYLPVYRRWALSKTLNYRMYLCNAFGKEDNLLRLFIPTESEINDLWLEGYATFGWAHGNTSIPYADYLPKQPFTPLRRNILLFMCAMNNEL